MTPWLPDIGGIETYVDGVMDTQDVSAERLQQWREFWMRTLMLPSILVTEGGWVVNGRHRLALARQEEIPLFGLIVKHVGEHWVATGNLCRVR